jgi:hypothetical protein
MHLWENIQDDNHGTFPLLGESIVSLVDLSCHSRI